MYRFAVCDDVAKEREQLKSALDVVMHERRESFSLEEYSSADAFLTEMGEERDGFDLIFLDIFMDGTTGMEAARRLRSEGCRTPMVFLTTSADFAVESYEVEASGYLLKPLSEEKLALAIDRVLAAPRSRKIDLRSGRETVYAELADISYVESEAYRLVVHLTDGSTIETREKLDSLEKRLGDPRFLRCHHSYLVNMDCISRSGADFSLSTGETVPIRVRSRRQTVEKYQQYVLSRL